MLSSPARAMRALLLLTICSSSSGLLKRQAARRPPRVVVMTPAARPQQRSAGVSLLQHPPGGTTMAPAVEGQLFQQLEAMGAQNGGIIEGHSNQVTDEMMAMNKLAEDPNIKSICETGFNAGHSSLRWLLHSQAKVYSFDMGGHPYSKPAAAWLNQIFPGRLTNTWGDSTQTIPVFRLQHPEVRCNLIFVDGGHDYPVAAADLQNFMDMADPSYNIVLLDDVFCGMVYCQGPNMAWMQMIQNNQILQTAQNTEPGGARGYAIGSYKHPPALVAAAGTTPSPQTATTSLVALATPPPR